MWGVYEIAGCFRQSATLACLQSAESRSVTTGVTDTRRAMGFSACSKTVPAVFLVITSTT
jgi:hypothetical protein